MAKLNTRCRHSRGAAALEFALTMPILLIIFAGIIGFGLMVFAQYQIGSLANQTARTCVARQQSLGGDATDSLIACATSTFQTLYSTESPSLCSQAPSVQPSTQVLGTPLQSGRQTYLLVVKVQCQKNYLPLLNTYTRGGLTTQLLQAQSAMPFVP